MALLWKMICNLGDPTSLRHPVTLYSHCDAAATLARVAVEIVLRGGYLYGAWPRTLLILIEFKFVVPQLQQLVMFCTCRILPEGLKFVGNFPVRELR